MWINKKTLIRWDKNAKELMKENIQIKNQFLEALEANKDIAVFNKDLVIDLRDKELQLKRSLDLSDRLLKVLEKDGKKF